MQRAWRSLRTYQFVFHWGNASQSICNYLSHVPRLLSIIQGESLIWQLHSISLSLSHFPRLFGSLVWFECGPWVDISIALAQLLWLSILKLLLVFLSRLLIPQISIAISFALSLALCVEQTPGDRDELWMWPQAFYSHCLQAKLYPLN